MKPSHILMALIEGGGNVPPMLGLAKKLKCEGHAITILSEPCLAEPIKEMGAAFIPFTEVFTRSNRNEDLFRDWNASKFNNPIFERIMFGPSPKVIDQCIDVIQRRAVDLLVVDVLIFPAITAAEYSNIPKIIVFHMPEFLPGPNRPPGNMGIKPGTTFLHKIRDRVLTQLMYFSFDKFKSILNEKRLELSLSPLKHTLDLFDRAEIRMIQTSQSFDYPIKPRPKNVRYWGPELADPDWAAESTINLRLNKKEKPCVVVSFSSTFQNQASAIQNSISALAQMDVVGIVTLGPAMQEHTFSAPGHVEVLKSAKHSELFPQADLLITHGGHGTIMRALSFGVPILCLPMGRDQDDNAIKLVSKGCGLTLPPAASPKSIQKAVEELLSSEAYSNHAKRMRTELRSRDERERVLQEINNIVRSPIISPDK